MNNIDMNMHPARRDSGVRKHYSRGAKNGLCDFRSYLEMSCQGRVICRKRSVCTRKPFRCWYCVQKQRAARPLMACWVGVQHRLSCNYTQNTQMQYSESFSHNASSSCFRVQSVLCRYALIQYFDQRSDLNQRSGLSISDNEQPWSVLCLLWACISGGGSNGGSYVCTC